ncbi:hypothetical protein Avbf_07404 [Armadillidium vulgare]|nr:hypothetical protein Avbf_07404 [Armadillidium vulgare]
MKYIPQIAGAKGEDLWLGVVQYNTRAFTITGEDVTDAYLIQIYDGNYIDGQCYILDFPNGQFSAKDIDCRTHQEFICEYPLTTGNEIHNNCFLAGTRVLRFSDRVNFIPWRKRKVTKNG